MHETLRNTLTFLLLLLGLEQPRASIPTSQPATSGPTTAELSTLVPVVAIWCEGGYPAGVRTNMLIVGVWSDGTVDWSEPRASGAKKFRSAKVSTDRVGKLLHDLQAAQFFTKIRQSYVGPDSGYTVVAGQTGGKHQCLESWHDPPPKDPNIVIDEKGIYSIKPGEARPEPSDEYKNFLHVWDRSRRLIEEIVTAQGEPVTDVDLDVYRRALSEQG